MYILITYTHTLIHLILFMHSTLLEPLNLKSDFVVFDGCKPDITRTPKLEN